MTRPPKWPEPGIYHDIPFPQYLALDAVNSSKLRDIASKTPKHARYYATHGHKVSDSMKLGSAVNHQLLEQGLALDTIAIWKERKSNGAMMPMKGAKFEAFEEANPGRMPISEKIWTEAGFVAAGVRRNPAARELLRTRRGTEVTVLWERAGRKCKARLDIWGRDYSITDLKVCGISIAKRKFAWHAWGYRWDMQAAWYREALISRDIDCPRCSILPVEAKQPHDCVLYDWPESALDQAEQANGEAFEDLLRCERDQRWPGHGVRDVLDDGPWKGDDSHGLGGPKVDFGDIPK
jgi:hypothetical protein